MMSKLKNIEYWVPLVLLAGTVSAQERPNVLFIICDDLNNHVSTSDYIHTKTPAFDHLAKNGVRFTRAYCQYPVCGPSRASFLSGLYPESTGIVDNAHDIRKTRPGTPELPGVFKNSGYWTARVGKVYHHAEWNPPELWHDNPDRFENDEMPMVTEAREKFEAEHKYIRGKNRAAWLKVLQSLGPQTVHRKKGIPHGPSGLTDEQHKDGKNALAIIDHLENRPYGDKPFFMACGIQKPHVPFLAPDKYFDMYPQDKIIYDETPLDFWSQAPKLAQHTRYKNYGFKLSEETPARRREFMQAYHACISFMDAQIGKIFDTLKRTGQWDNTIIVLTADNGYQLGEHFMWGKGCLFEETSRVPLVIRVPKKIKSVKTSIGSKNENIAELLDLYPTLLDLCKIKKPDHLQGTSLIPMLENPTASVKDVAYTIVCRPSQKEIALEDAVLGKAIRTKKWRYTRWPDGEELYNLDKDPKEYKNLASSPEYKKQLQTLRKQLKAAENRAQSKRTP